MDHLLAGVLASGANETRVTASDVGPNRPEPIGKVGVSSSQGNALRVPGRKKTARAGEKARTDRYLRRRG